MLSHLLPVALLLPPEVVASEVPRAGEATPEGGADLEVDGPPDADPVDEGDPSLEEERDIAASFATLIKKNK